MKKPLKHEYYFILLKIMLHSGLTSIEEALIKYLHYYFKSYPIKCFIYLF